MTPRTREKKKPYGEEKNTSIVVHPIGKGTFEKYTSVYNHMIFIIKRDESSDQLTSIAPSKPCVFKGKKSFL